MSVQLPYSHWWKLSHLLLYCVNPLYRACPISIPVTFRYMVVWSPPTALWTIAWWWRSQTLAATLSLVLAKVKLHSPLAVRLFVLHFLTFACLLPPRLVDRPGAPEGAGYLSERRRLQLRHHRPRDCSQKEYFLHGMLHQPSWYNTQTDWWPIDSLISVIISEGY